MCYSQLAICRYPLNHSSSIGIDCIYFGIANAGGTIRSDKTILHIDKIVACSLNTKNLKWLAETAIKLRLQLPDHLMTTTRRTALKDRHAAVDGTEVGLTKSSTKRSKRVSRALIRFRCPGPRPFAMVKGQLSVSTDLSEALQRLPVDLNQDGFRRAG
jgi:hypothetical protein